jgi:hypothetical protein
VVLGEANRMTDAILSDSAPRKEAHLFGRNQYMSTYFHSLSYLASKKRLHIEEGERYETADFRCTVFFHFTGRSIR